MCGRLLIAQASGGSDGVGTTIAAAMYARYPTPSCMAELMQAFKKED